MASEGVLLQTPKSALKAAASRVLPEHVLERPKMGFTPPVREWIRGIWQAQESSLQSPVLLGLSAFDQTQVLRTIRTPIGRSGKIDQISLRLLTLELWMRGIT